MPKTMPKLNAESVARAAAQGDPEATDLFLQSIVDDVHGLAMRMLWHPIDAEDATEEILLEVLSQLPDVRDGSIRMHVLGVAARFLMRTYESPMERQDWTFDEMGAHLDRGVSDHVPAEVSENDRPVLAEELMVGCTQTMLLCLDRPHRLAYVLAEVFELDENTAAKIVSMEPVLFRALLEKAKVRLHAFMTDRCGVVNEAASCRCNRRLGRDLRTGRVDPRRLLFVFPPVPERPANDGRATDPARVFRDQRLRRAPRWIVERVATLARASEPLEALRA